MISMDKNGGRTVHLFIPFEFNKVKIEAITIAPLRLGHVLRWNEGAWKTSIELLVELAGVDESVIRELRYPDADRVMEAFMAMVTPEMREDMTIGRIPIKTEDDLVEVREEKATNGSGEPLGPGVPLPDDMDDYTQPQAGFDMSEEP